jgi:ABC-type glutathione transport system ATPase component
VLVIEHNLDVVKSADHVIDLGPAGGVEGGRVVATGTPEELAKNPKSITGPYLAEVLARSAQARGAKRASAASSTKRVELPKRTTRVTPPSDAKRGGSAAKTRRNAPPGAVLTNPG